MTNHYDTIIGSQTMDHGQWTMFLGRQPHGK